MPDALIDRLAVSEVLDDYARGIDSRDWDLVVSCFTDDAHLDYSSARGPAGDRNEVVAWIEQSLSRLSWIHHVVSNFHVDLDGDMAQVRSMFHCTAQLPAVERPIVTGGYYHEVYVRTGGGWRIQRLLEDNRWMTA